MLRKVWATLAHSQNAEPVEPSTASEVSARVVDAPDINEKMRRALNSGLMRGLFSQLGEDGTILWLFEGKRKGFYVDIGCHNPLVYSNTAALHLWHDWNGLNVDIDERAIALFNEWRPDDINVHAGVGKEALKTKAIIFEAGALSTLDSSAAANPMYADIARYQVDIEILPLHALLLKYLPPGQQVDFLNVDAEGLDYEILVSNDWNNYRPTVISVEAASFNPSNPTEDRTFQLLTQKGYRLVSHTVITSIFSLIT